MVDDNSALSFTKTIISYGTLSWNSQGDSHYWFQFAKDLSSIPKSFTEVPVTEAGVDTVQFLLASEGLVGMFGMFIY